MGMRNAKKEVLDRLASKTLDAQFAREVTEGLGCSRFEAEAVLRTVKEVYGAAGVGSDTAAGPGTITLLAVSSDEPAGKPVRDCEKRVVRLTVHRGSEDDRLLQEQGTTAFRRARLADLCQAALSQGALLTREDLAYRIFFVGLRTISRDLSVLRKTAPQTPVPLRSIQKDIGPVLTHRVQIVRLALQGKTTTQICSILHHSPEAVTNYLGTFARCAYLCREGLQDGQIAFLLRRGVGLIRQYRALLDDCGKDRNMRYHLDEMLSPGRRRRPGPKKGDPRRRTKP